MSLQFGVASITVSGIAIARLMNVTINVNYDSAVLRGGNLIFPTNQQLFNGSVEGTFEVGDINITAIGAMLGGDVTYANGSGTVLVTATQVLLTGAALVVSAVTDGVTSTFTINNCKFNTMGINMDRENYTIPSTNFVAVGDSNGDIFSWQT